MQIISIDKIDNTFGEEIEEGVAAASAQRLRDVVRLDDVVDDFAGGQLDDEHAQVGAPQVQGHVAALLRAVDQLRNEGVLHLQRRRQVCIALVHFAFEHFPYFKNGFRRLAETFQGNFHLFDGKNVLKATKGSPIRVHDKFTNLRS